MQRATATKVACEFFYDSHCHLREAVLRDTEGSGTASSSVARDETRPRVASVVLCGTHPQIDWDDVAKVMTKSNGTQKIIGFGVHPWFVPPFPIQSQRRAEEKMDLTSSVVPQGEQKTEAHDCCCSGAADDAITNLSLSVSEILVDLEQRLSVFPRAIVAEIGLDKLHGPPEAIQKEVFVAQLRMAAAHHRPVSVHCVRHYGLAMQILQDLSAEDTPPAIILHAFTGSMEVAKSLLNLKNKKPAHLKATETEPKQALRTVASTHDEDGHNPTDAPAQHTKKKTKRGSGAFADTVRMRERIFFGVGLSTSFTVKGFATQTLPFLLSAQKVLLETDAHYSVVRGWLSDNDGAEHSAEAAVHVNEQEYAGELSEVLCAVETAAAQSAEFTKKAQESGLAPDAMARQAVAAAYTNAFRSVLN